VAIIPPPKEALPAMSPPNPAAFAAAAQNPPLNPEWPNSRDWKLHGLAAGGGSSNARSLSRLYDVLANGGEIEGRRLLSANTIKEATQERIAGIDQVTGAPGSYAAGFRLNSDGKMGPHEHSFGHAGWGGSMAFGDPERGLGVAYVMNQMRISSAGAADARVARLLRATYAALEAGTA
jgi:CubicO group peptidase (beta-lactamase class C family)